MMIPRSALIIGLAALIPFVWGAATQLVPKLADFGLRWMGPVFLGPDVSLSYGTIVLAFNAGILWGFATRAARNVAWFYLLSLLPALWAFAFVGGSPVASALLLAVGFFGLTALNWVFWRHGFAPAWWLRLEVPSAAVAVACLMVPAFG